MASQGSQGPLPSSSLLPLSKFSHATSSRLSEGQIPWIHVSSQNNLFVIFDIRVTHSAAGNAEERQYFKIIQDPTILEDIDLKILASEARRAASEVKAAQDPRINPQVAVLVRKPCIAIKYPVNNGIVCQFRRFQVRFTKEEDYYETMKIFTKAGVPVLEAGNIPKQNDQPSHRPITTEPQQIGGAGMPQIQQRPASLTFGQDASTTFAGSSFVHSKIATQTSIAANVPTPHSVQLTQFSPSAMQCQHQTISDYRPATELYHHPNHNHGVYSNAASISISSQPQHVVSSGINVYTPRPSTAPEVITPVTKDAMPPKRELPFARRGKLLNSRSEKDDTTNLSLSTEQVTAVDAPSTAQCEVIDSCSKPATQTTKAVNPKPRKRAAPKPKKTPASKKPKTVVSRSKSITQGQAPIPSAAELVGHMEEVVPTIDTQSICATAEAKLAASEKIMKVLPLPSGYVSEPEKDCDDTVQSTKVNPVKQTTTTRSQSQHVKSVLADVQDSMSTSQTPAQNHPCTTADQLIQNSTHITTNSSTTSHDKNSGHETPQSSRPKHTPMNPRPSPSEHQSDTATMTTVTTTTPTVLSPSLFAEATHKLKDFTALPPSQQHEILEKFICQSLDDENFKSLCKTIEGVWSRALCLKP